MSALPTKADMRLAAQKCPLSANARRNAAKTAPLTLNHVSPVPQSQILDVFQGLER